MICRILLMAGLFCGMAWADAPLPTVGGGRVDEPAIGPGPSHGIGEGKTFVLVKNWDFGRDGTIRNIDEMNEHFQYHDQFGGGESETNYHKSWANGMAKYGITEYDASEWHVWTLHYRADNTFTAHVDGRVVQNGSTPWTLATKPDGEPLNMSFIFDGAWGHRLVKSVNHWLDASELDGTFYEWDYSRVYLSSDPQ